MFSQTIKNSLPIQFRVVLLALSFVCLMYHSASIASDYSKRPGYLNSQTISTYYDGKKDDLLTAGLSFKELSSRKLATPVLNASSTSLRKLAYFNNILALVDTTVDGGYGKLFGPEASHSAVPGTEYMTHSTDENNEYDATYALQIPDNFDRKKACIIVAASSGSRGIYGAVGTVGFWALTHQCAIVYTDKGTGTGYYFPDKEKGFDQQGRYLATNKNSKLTYKDKTNAKKQDFLRKHPSAIATKQAHSRKNIESRFGQYVYQAAQFALYQLNQHFLKEKITYTKENTIIIAASISNGGVASLRGAEYDGDNVFDAVVAAEPNIYPPVDHKLEIIKGGIKAQSHSIPGYDTFILQNLYSPCTLLTKEVTDRNAKQRSKTETSRLKDWCFKLREDGFIKGDSSIELASSALNRLNKFGIDDNQQVLSPIMDAIKVWPALAITYSNQMGHYSFGDNPCGVYFTAFDANGTPSLLDEQKRQFLFANSNGIPPTAGVSFSSTRSNYSAYQQAKCFYELSQSERIRKGVKQVTASGNLHNKPTIIIHGANDNLVMPNHSSRAYYGTIMRNGLQSAKNIRYYEVSNAQHFDAFLTLPKFAERYIPLHYYFEQSLDLMMAHLIDGKPLPPSQLVNTQTRRVIGGKLEILKQKHLSPISSSPSSPIQLKGNQLIIP